MRSLLFLLVLSGCESGLTRAATVTVPADVPPRFSATSPGLLVADLGSRVAPYVVLCGQTPKNPVHLSDDLGFGCLGSRDGTQETVRVWVQPMPAGWDVDAGCATVAERSYYSTLALSSGDGGLPLPAMPEASWPQGTATGTWKRDLSPCGGALVVDVTLAVP
jgi:hypothetical protein